MAACADLARPGGSLYFSTLNRNPKAFLFAVVLGWDLVWVWSVILFDHVARALWLLVTFRRGRWAERAMAGGDRG